MCHIANFLNKTAEKKISLTRYTGIPERLQKDSKSAKKEFPVKSLNEILAKILPYPGAFLTFISKINCLENTY
ncbi:hypothetical protein A4H97_03930 [Niastella yeongjuensis]|uniref:Uncharacterized protein n=1 Tax=Niastella yeongjuensis TaxID=354355 RepID=A0A1V9EXX8_9BACT|nr:hypothetical protein A4H97_03930 [Niastella yeongjuensis]